MVTIKELISYGVDLVKLWELMRISIGTIHERRRVSNTVDKFCFQHTLVCPVNTGLLAQIGS